MSREILFRAKRKNWMELPKEEWWVEGDLRQDRDLETAFISGWNYYISENGTEREPFEYEISPETLCQYTGLTDKNGKRIWENDICKYTGRKRPMKVIFDLEEGAWALNYIYGIGTDNKGLISVIGNAFDNPELTFER